MSRAVKATLALVVLATIVTASPLRQALRGAAHDPRPGAAPKKAPPARFLIAVDVSASSEPLRRKFLGLTDLIVDQVAPRHSLVRVYPFARTHTVAYSGMAGSARQLWDPLEPYLTSSALGRGTCPREVLEAMAAETEANATPAFVVACWDGENTDGAPLAPVAQQLAQMPQLKATWIVGPLPDLEHGFRVQVEEAFRPLGDRCIVSSMPDRAAGLEAFELMVARSLSDSAKEGVEQ